MATALLHNHVVQLGGFPDYAYDGDHIVIDTGDESGTWQIALTSSGTLNLNKKIKNATIQMQGGGGAGGAGYASGSGSDGEDGSIESVTQTISAGAYSIEIGAGGARKTNAAGGSGGATTFGDLLTASGGSGGAYKGGATKSHSSIYENYGKGGTGGTTSQYSTTTTGIQWYVTARQSTYRYASPDISSTRLMSISAGVNMYLSQYAGLNTTPTTITGADGNQWWQQGTSGYLLASHFGTPVKTGGDTIAYYYGNNGNPGVIILSGKA